MGRGDAMMIRDVEADIALALRRGRSSKTVADVLAFLWRGEARLLIHPAGSCSWRWKDGRCEILHACGRWDGECIAWMLERMPDPRLFTWEGRPGWLRFLQMRGILS